MSWQLVSLFLILRHLFVGIFRERAFLFLLAFNNLRDNYDADADAGDDASNEKNLFHAFF